MLISSIFHSLRRISIRSLSYHILVFNCGSSSIKYQVINPQTREVLLKGSKDRLHESIYQDSIEKIFSDVEKSGISLNAIGHRWVNGGAEFSKPILVTDKMIQQLQDIVSLAPLHNPHNLRGILTGKQVNPSLPHVVVFDTAFHNSIRDTIHLYPIPLDYSQKYKLRKYGFHGISYQYISSALYDYFAPNTTFPISRNVGIFHLGSGCSASVLTLSVKPNLPYDKKFAVCHDTTMGFTPLDGLMMGTRSGSIDPSIVSYLSQIPQAPHSLDDVMNILNKKSGLLGISGMTQDARDLFAYIESHRPPGSDLYELFRSHFESSNDDPNYTQYQRVILSINMFCHRAAKEMLGLTASLSSPLEVIVFTGGIGEKSAIMRKLILSHMKSLREIVVDDEMNDQNNFCMTKEGQGSLEVYVIPTNEELQIAIETERLLNS